MIYDNQHIAIIGMSERVKYKLFLRLWWCHADNLEVKDVKIRPDSKCAIGVLDWSHRCIADVRLHEPQDSA